MTSLIEDGPLQGLLKGGYKVILADPPWNFENFSAKGEGKNPNSVHYPCMGIEAIRDLPVQDLAAKDCVLIVWCTSPFWHLVQGVIQAWGFTPKTKGGWAKESKTGNKLAFGTGYILRGAHEDFYIATKGKPVYASRSERNLMIAPLREHSRKPDEQYAKWENAFGDVPRIELFARHRWPGWDAWGNETGKFFSSDGLEATLAENRRARSDFQVAFTGER